MFTKLAHLQQISCELERGNVEELELQPTMANKEEGAMDVVVEEGNANEIRK